MKAFFKKVILNNNFLSLTGSAAASGLGFISFGILVRILDKDAFGNWMIFLTICTLAELLRTGLLQTGLIRFSAGKDTDEKNEILGSGWIFAILTTICLGVVTFLPYVFLGHWMTYQGVNLFFKWYWLLTIVSLPFNFASWHLQSKSDFKNLLFIRLIVLVGFIALLIYSIYSNAGLSQIVSYYIISQAFCSLICLVLGWTRISTISKASITSLKVLFHFGKYSMGTMLGANLLRNSDTLLIGAFLSAEAVALYSVPLKLFEIVEIPLRSFVATALPNMSKLLNEGNKIGFSRFFEKVTGAFSLILIPVVILCLVFAETLVILLGGAEYAEAAIILRIFAMYAVFMPLDRYTGIALDVLNKPSLNFIKVFLMLGFNIIGDILVLKLTSLLWPVAVVSIGTFLVGVLLGVFFLKKHIDFSIKSLFYKGYGETKAIYTVVKSKLLPEAA